MFIVSTSRVVRLFEKTSPYAMPDRRRSADTGKYYGGDDQPISLKPRWFVHERCYVKHYGQPDLPHPEESSKEWFEHRKAAVDKLLRERAAANLGEPPRGEVFRVVFAADEDLLRSYDDYVYAWYAERTGFFWDPNEDANGLTGSAVEALLAEFDSAEELCDDVAR